MHPIAAARGQVRDGKGAAADGVLSHCTQARELCSARVAWRAVCDGGQEAASDGVLSHCTQAKELCGARMVWRAVCVCVCIEGHVVCGRAD